MSVEVTRVGYGPPAAEALRSAISRAKGGGPLTPVTVVVPSNYLGVATRRLLASGALGPVCSPGIGLAAVSFLTVYRMAELLGSSPLAGAGRRPVSTPVIAAALRAALAERPGIFAPVAGHAATETALIAAYRELRDLSDGALDALARRSDRAADVVRLHRAARTRLESDWYDEEDLIDSAIETLRSSEAAARRLGTVVVHLPERLSRHGGSILKTIGELGDLVVLAGSTGDRRADAEVDLSVRRIGGNGAGGRGAPVEPMAIVDAGRTRIVTVSDCDEEVRVAVRAVVDAARAGTPLDRMAILHASPEPYARLAHEQLTAAGIPLNGAAVMPLTARVAGRTLLQLFELPESGFRREEVFAWLAGARLRRDGGAIPVTAWERLSRDAGVVGGRRDWDLRLATLADDLDAEATRDEADPDSPDWRAGRSRQKAARGRDLRAFVLGLIDDLAEAAARPRPWGERVAWARRHVANLFGSERRRATWPMAEQKAAERVERALDRLACLDAVEESVALDVFTRTIELELEADLGRVGRMGEGVLVGSIAMGVGLDLDLVVVLGLAEGLFPSPTRDDSLLPDHEREATGEELPLRASSVERQHRQLLAALAGASRHVLCVPRGDLRRNIERVPSRWVLAIASALAGERWWSDELLTGDRPWLAHVASFDGGLRHVAFPANEQEHRLRLLMGQGSTRLSAPALAAAGDATLDTGAGVVAARRSDRFTRFDGNLAGLAIPSPADQPTSATRLETWAGCPFAYLLQSILRVEDVENPEDQLQISPRDWGSLVHEALEVFITEVLARPPAGQPAPTEPWSAADRERLMQIGEGICARYETHGLTGRAVFWKRDKKRILADLDRFLRADSDHRTAHGTRPVAAELAFGLPHSSLSTIAIPLPDGRSVQFRGMADRVDVADDGTIHVVDYKTGSSRGYGDLSEDNPDAQGQRLQLAVYGQAARMLRGAPLTAVIAEYWFVSAKGKFDRVGYPVTPDVLDKVGATIGTMVAGIEAGVFPHYPTATSTSPFNECPSCDPDGLGVTDLRRAFEAKSSDPAMAVFVGLAEPLADTPLERETEQLPAL
ncbi:MAG TPA: PD-(D/E)XK nuclease family protein [Acidimicrobiales bacterium]|nr:PD-(D/E)XK nuclease family protein [Acidimicrobiales bacterium]